MRLVVLSVGKMLFQLSVLIFIVGYCFGFWFKSKKQKLNKPLMKTVQPMNKVVANSQLGADAEAA